MTNSGDPWELLDELDQPGLLRRECGRLRDFMLASCRLLKPLLPPEADKWLQVGEDYRLKRATAAELERVRVAAWQFLGEESHLKSPAVLAVRAVICLLNPDDYDEGRVWFETLHYFMHFSNDAEDHQQEQCDLLLKLFPECFSDRLAN